MPGNAQVDARGGARFTGGVIRKAGEISVDPPNIAGLATGTVAVTISGARIGDLILLIPPDTFGSVAAGATGENGYIFQGAAVTANNTVTLRFYNAHATQAQNPGARTWTFLLIGV